MEAELLERFGDDHVRHLRALLIDFVERHGGAEELALDNAIAAAAGQRKSKVKKVIARAAAMNCYLKVIDRPSPYKAAGSAQMDAQHYCLDAVADLDIYLHLRKLYNGNWYTMDGRWWDNQPWSWWAGSFRWLCDGSPHRNWRAAANAYVMYEGVVYGAHQHHDNWICCG